MSWFLYILKSDRIGNLYVGSSVDPERRLMEHNGGHVRATKGRGPWRRIALIRFKGQKEARHAEAMVKRLRNRNIIDKIVNGSFIWSENSGVLK